MILVCGKWFKFYYHFFLLNFLQLFVQAKNIMLRLTVKWQKLWLYIYFIIFILETLIYFRQNSTGYKLQVFFYFLIYCGIERKFCGKTIKEENLKWYLTIGRKNCGFPPLPLSGLDVEHFVHFLTKNNI